VFFYIKNGNKQIFSYFGERKKKVLRVLLVFGSLASEYVEMSMRRQK